MTIKNVNFEWDGKGSVYISSDPESIKLFQFNAVEITNTKTGKYIYEEFYQAPLDITRIIKKGENSINVNFMDEQVYNDWKDSGAPYLVQTASTNYIKVINSYTQYALLY